MHTVNQCGIHINKQARYFTLGSVKNDKIVYVLHGYGQLASYFIQKFQSLADNGYYVVAPEGLHRFYLEGTSGRVGASWMTREERESDIEDNVLYLKNLHQEISAQHTYNSVSILGFSQGGATAARWFAQSEIVCDKFILWACVFPDDMKTKFETSILKNTELTFVVGDEDQYFTGTNREELINFYKELKFSIILYRGTHQIDPQIVEGLFEK